MRRSWDGMALFEIKTEPHVGTLLKKRVFDNYLVRLYRPLKDLTQTVRNAA